MALRVFDEMINVYIHRTSDVESKDIGAGTTIWQYCVIFPGAKIGENCNICANVLIENDVTVGNNVTIKSGVQLWDGVRLGNDVFVGPNATFANDLFPRSKQRPDRFLEIIVGVGATIGANATILPGIVIGAGAMIGAGAVVTKNVPSNAIIVGNPGVITGYTDIKSKSRLLVSAGLEAKESTNPINMISGCGLYYLPLISDMRGGLSVAEYEDHVPFLVKRCFWIFNVPTSEIRGEHAHKTLHQYLICVKGSVNVMLDDGDSRQEVILNKSNLGLHIPPLVWGVQYKYSADAVLLVLASDKYDSSDYLRDYEEFCFYVKKGINRL